MKLSYYKIVSPQKMNNILFQQPEILQKYFDFSIIILGLIVVFDLIIKVKRPIQLKLCFLGITISILLFSIFRLFMPINIFTISAIGVIKLFFAISIINMFTYIYFNSFRKLVKVISFTFFVFTITYFSYILMNNIPIEGHNQNSWGTFYFTVDLHSYSLKIPLIFHILRAIFVFSTISILFYFCIQLLRTIDHNNQYFKKLRVFTFSILCYFIILVILFISRIFITYSLNIYNVVSMFFIQVFLLIVIMYRPEFLNRSGFKINILKEMFKSESLTIDKSTFSHLFFNQYYFKDKNANVADMAKLMMVSKIDLITYVQNDFGYSFDDLVNKNRIEYFIKLIKQPQFQNFTIDALAQESGFISRNSFYKPFKRFHGGNPSDLIEFNS